jgi:hypothetical protein
VEFKLNHYPAFPPPLDPGCMTNLLPALAVAFAAFCVWLTVRIINRRERWAKGTAVVVGLPVLYVMSFGPACWLTSRMNSGAAMIPVAYAPIVKCLSGKNMELRRTIGQFSRFGASPGWTWRPDVPIRDKLVKLEHWKWCSREQHSVQEARKASEYFRRIRMK